MSHSKSKRIKFLHLSDFHMGKVGYPQEFVLSKIIENIKYKIERDGEPDFIFVTGDIANKGHGDEYEKFWELLIAPLGELIPTLLTDKLFMVPGNHDLNRNKNDAFDRTTMLKTTASYFDPKEESKEKRDIVIARFQQYIEHDVTGYSELFRKKEGAYSVTVRKNDCAVGIVGLNTAWLCKDEHDYKRLTPGKSLLDSALLNLQQPDLTIVLGHHPLDWFSADHFRPISALMAKNHAIYLHGHMHDAWASPTYGAGNQFLNIQCGAAFQAHETDRWKNGLIWAEADLNSQTIALQSYEWSSDNQEWVLNEKAFPAAHKQGDYWKYILPKKMNAIYKEALEGGGSNLPGGWGISNIDTLKINLAELPLDEAIAFFNGAVPTWRTALSSSIPRRKIVQKAANIFKSISQSDKPVVGLISSAGCEGKTTVLLQCAYEVVCANPEIQVLRRHNDFRPFNHAAILDVVGNDKKWLVVLDEADQEAESILEFINKYIDRLAGKVHFLLACRDSAWISSSAVNLRWSSAHFKHERLTGLTQGDADLIVASWAAYGDDGLGALAKTEPLRRAAIFKEYADKESRKDANSGALFGALLIVRHGDDLHEHARSIVEKLELVDIGNGVTLKDAITYIAVMHAEDQYYLCKDVLQEVLGFGDGSFHSSVIKPLGQEAAATATSTYVYTRHKYIAKEIVKVLSDDYSIDIQECYIKLVKSALAIMSKGIYLEDLDAWRFKLADHFMAKKESQLAIKLVENVKNHDPSDTYTITHLASLYRISNRAKNAVDMFREIAETPKVNRRAFFFEWSVSEGFFDNPFESATLSLYALSDDCEYMPLPVDRAIVLLNGVSESFKKLHARFPDKEFMNAFHSACALLLTCQQYTKLPAISQHAIAFGKDVELGRYKMLTSAAAVENLKAGFSLCRSYVRTRAVVDAIDEVDVVDFSCLERMVKNISSR